MDNFGYFKFHLETTMKSYIILQYMKNNTYRIKYQRITLTFVNKFN